MKKIIKIFMCLGFIILLSGCQDKLMLSVKDYKKIMTDNGFEITNTKENQILIQENLKERYSASKKVNNSQITVRYSIYSDIETRDNLFNLYCIKKLSTEYKENYMCHSQQLLSGKKYVFVSGKSLLEINYKNDEDLNYVKDLIEQLGYSEYIK